MRAAFFCLLASVVPAQQSQEPPVFRSTTRLVQVNVVVHGKKNAPVADLKKEDFTIFEKGKLQKIAFFSIESAAKLSQPIARLPQNVFSNRLGDRHNVPQSVTVILLDSLNTPWSDQAYARNQVLKFLSQIQPHERVALYSMGRGLRILHDYTSDASSLIERLKAWKGSVEPDLAASEGPADRQDAMDSLLPPELLGAEQNFADFIAGNRVLNTLHSLESVAEHLAAVPGRKNLIWVSGGFPLMIGFDDFDFEEQVKANPNMPMRDKRTFFDEVERTVRAFNHANVAIYPVDARGLMADPTFSATRSGVPRNSRVWSPPNLDTMDTLADRTGGKAYYNRNDIDHAVREVFEDSQITYTLGYYPLEPDPKGSFRDLKVKINRPGLSLRYRKGYFAFSEMDSNDSKTISAEMKNAVWSPLDATAVAMNARVDLIKDKNAYSIYAQVDPATISLRQDADRWVGRIDFAFVQKTDDGRPVSSIGDTLQLNLTKATYVKLLKEGLIFHRSMPVQQNARFLRIVARDAPSGLAGSLTVPLAKVVEYVPKPAPPKPAPSEPSSVRD